MKNSTFIHKKTETVTHLSVKNCTLETETIKKGNSRKGEKEFSSEREVEKAFLKKSWELLKKDAIEYNPDAKPGTPLLQKLINRWHTGASSFAITPQGIYVYSPGNWDQKGNDSLLLLDIQGEVVDTIPLPDSLLWHLEYDDLTQKLWMDLDHHIYSYDLQSKEFTCHLRDGKVPASFLEMNKDYIVYGSHPRYVVMDRQTRNCVERPLEASVVRGDIPFCIALSKKTNQMAFHNRSGRIHILDIKEGTILTTIRGKFGRVDKIFFTDDDTTLTFYSYTSDKQFFVDIATGKIRKEAAFTDEYGSIGNLAFNEDRTLLAQFYLYSCTVHIYDYPTKKLLHEIKLDHTVRHAEIRFLGDMLGVYSDRSCFSLFRIR